MTLEIVGDRILQILFESGPFLSSIMLQVGALIGIFSSLLLFQDGRELVLPPFRRTHQAVAH